MEARSVDAKMLTRRCIIVRLRELTVVSYRKLVSQNVGAVLVLLPDNFTNITVEEKEVSIDCFYFININQDNKSRPRISVNLALNNPDPVLITSDCNFGIHQFCFSHEYPLAPKISKDCFQGLVQGD